MSRGLLYISVLALSLSIATRLTAATPFSLPVVDDGHVCNDSQYGPTVVYNTPAIHIRNTSDPRRRVGYLKFDISTTRAPGQVVSNVSVSLYGYGAGDVDVYGVVESLDHTVEDFQRLTWNTAPGVKNDPAPPVSSPVQLDMADMVGPLLSFRTPASGVRASSPTSQALADFINEDTDGIIVLLLAAHEGQSAMIRELDWNNGEGAARLEGEVDVLPMKAREPNPSNGLSDVWRDVAMSWTPGSAGAKHNVYLGTSQDDVTAATAADPHGTFFSLGQAAATYDPPGHLEFEKTYYWRVDEVNAPPESTVHVGNIWSFTVEPFVRRGENIIATASSFDGDAVPMNTVNGSGLDATGLLHSTLDKAMWLTVEGDTQPWIRFEFDRAYMLHEMWVWNYNLSLEKSLGVGFKDVLIEYSLNGKDWTTLRDSQRFNQGPSADNYEHNTTVDFNDVAARYVRLTPKSNWRSMMVQYGLSEVRFFYVPAQARVPVPDINEVDVDPRTAVLSWRSGRQAASHEVYLSLDAQAVTEGTALAAILTDPRHIPPSLLLGETYSWKVVEVNQAETPRAWDGDVWSFSTLQYLPIDDFEQYNEDYKNLACVYQTWIDGIGFTTPATVPGNGSGASVGHPTWDSTSPHYNQTTVETGITMPGSTQSMPLYYDNSDPAKKYYSETVRTWKEPQNWTIHGADTLRVCFRGGALGFEETAPGTVTMSAAGADIYGTADEFTFASKSLNGNGSITVRVDSVENSHVWAKAGVMIRESLYADARHAIAYVTPDGRVGWEYRQLTAGTTENTRSNPGAVTLPHWIRLTRDGDTITAAHSSDGVTWSPIVDADSPTEPSFLQFPMTASVFVGLALTSHAAGVTCTAEFSGIAMAGASGAWQFTEIGVDHMLNDRADLYVTVRDTSGRTETAKYPDGTIIDEWTEWDIPFTTFTGAGVNMAAVSTMAIGVGDPKNPKAGGVGTLYIDDIGFGRTAE